MQLVGVMPRLKTSGLNGNENRSMVMNRDKGTVWKLYINEQLHALFIYNGK